MEDLIRKIQIHLETTEECIENTSLPQYVVELLEADNKLLSEVVTNYQTERMYSEEDIMNALHSVELKNNKDYSKIYNSMKEFLNNLKK
jgi:hypothetical protein